MGEAPFIPFFGADTQEDIKVALVEPRTWASSNNPRRGVERGVGRTP